jgi:hypothetical protein
MLAEARKEETPYLPNVRDAAFALAAMGYRKDKTKPCWKEKNAIMLPKDELIAARQVDMLLLTKYAYCKLTNFYITRGPKLMYYTAQGDTVEYLGNKSVSVFGLPIRQVLHDKETAHFFTCKGFGQVDTHSTSTTFLTPALCLIWDTSAELRSSALVKLGSARGPIRRFYDMDHLHFTSAGGVRLETDKDSGVAVEPSETVGYIREWVPVSHIAQLTGTMPPAVAIAIGETIGMGTAVSEISRLASALLNSCVGERGGGGPNGDNMFETVKQLELVLTESEETRQRVDVNFSRVLDMLTSLEQQAEAKEGIQVFEECAKMAIKFVKSARIKIAYERLRESVPDVHKIVDPNPIGRQETTRGIHLMAARVGTPQAAALVLFLERSLGLPVPPVKKRGSEAAVEAFTVYQNAQVACSSEKPPAGNPALAEVARRLDVGRVGRVLDGLSVFDLYQKAQKVQELEVHTHGQHDQRVQHLDKCIIALNALYSHVYTTPGQCEFEMEEIVYASAHTDRERVDQALDTLSHDPGLLRCAHISCVEGTPEKDFKDVEGAVEDLLAAGAKGDPTVENAAERVRTACHDADTLLFGYKTGLAKPNGALEQAARSERDSTCGDSLRAYKRVLLTAMARKRIQCAAAQVLPEYFPMGEKGHLRREQKPAELWDELDELKKNQHNDVVQKIVRRTPRHLSPQEWDRIVEADMKLLQDAKENTNSDKSRDAYRDTASDEAAIGVKTFEDMLDDTENEEDELALAQQEAEEARFRPEFVDIPTYMTDDRDWDPIKRDLETLLKYLRENDIRNEFVECGRSGTPENHAIAVASPPSLLHTDALPRFLSPA